MKLDSFTFDSKAEARRYRELKLLKAAGAITDLIIHPVFSFSYRSNETQCRMHGFLYVADFRYKDRDGNDVIEDVKGVRTAEYKLKKQLIEGFWGVTITEIEAYPTRSKPRVKQKENPHASTHSRARGTPGSRQQQRAADRLSRGR